MLCITRITISLCQKIYELAPRNRVQVKFYCVLVVNIGIGHSFLFMVIK